MHPREPDESRLGAAERRPPSARSRDSLADGLRREVAEARVRFEEAGLRAETHRLLGNDDAALDATREQQDILADVEARLGRVVSAAVVQRDAEQVLADATDLPADVPAPAPDPHEVRPRTPMLAGVASLLAVVAVSAAAVLGVTQGLDSVEIVGAASDRETPEPASSSPTSGDGADEDPTSPAPLAGAQPGATTEPNTSDGATPAAPSEAVAVEDPTRTAPPNPPTGQAAVDESGDSELDQAVNELLDAVGDLEQRPDEDPDPSESDSETPSLDADISGEDLEDVVEEVVPDAPDGPQDGGTEGPQDSGTDGFVPAPSAQ